MSDDVNLKVAEGLANDSIPRIHMLTNVGIQFIETERNHPNIVPLLQQILSDIQQELTKGDANANPLELTDNQSELNAQKAGGIPHILNLPCARCSIDNRGNSDEIIRCLRTCFGPH